MCTISDLSSSKGQDLSLFRDKSSWKLNGNQLTLYTFCVHQEKTKKDYFFVVARYKVAFILLFDRLKSCIYCTFYFYSE